MRRVDCLPVSRLSLLARAGSQNQRHTVLSVRFAGESRIGPVVDKTRKTITMKLANVIEATHRTRSKRSRLLFGFAAAVLILGTGQCRSEDRVRYVVIGATKLSPKPTSVSPGYAKLSAAQRRLREFRRDHSRAGLLAADPIVAAWIEQRVGDRAVRLREDGTPRRNWTMFGTKAGEYAVQYWAGRYKKTGNPLYLLFGSLASRWTRDTWKDTVLTLLPSPHAKLAAAMKAFSARFGRKFASAVSNGGWLPPKKWAAIHAAVILRKWKAARVGKGARSGQHGKPFNRAATELEHLAKGKGIDKEYRDELLRKAGKFRQRARDINHK